MVKRLLSVITALALVLGTGCAKINPRLDPKLDQKIDNQNGKIRDIENFQNGIKSDINGIKQNAEISNSKLDHVQNGIANLNTQVSQTNQNQNSGLQILSGNGGLLVGLFGMGIMFFVLMGYRRTAQMNEKIADILAQKLVTQGNPELQEEVFKAAMYTEVEKPMLHLVKKHQVKLSSLFSTPR